MTRYLLVAAASIACTALPALVPGSGRAGGIAQAQAVSPSPTATVPSDSLKVVLLGTGVGPPVNLQQYGASTLVEAGAQRFLFDCGRGATLRLAQAGVPIGSITRVFLTHLHSDHVLQLPDLLLTGWAGGRRAVPLAVWGPAGTRAMMDHLQQAFAFDIHMRRDVDEHLPAAGITVVSHEVTTDGVVFDRARRDGDRVPRGSRPGAARVRLPHRLPGALSGAVRRYARLGESGASCAGRRRARA